MSRSSAPVSLAPTSIASSHASVAPPSHPLAVLYGVVGIALFLEAVVSLSLRLVLQGGCAGTSTRVSEYILLLYIHRPFSLLPSSCSSSLLLSSIGIKNPPRSQRTNSQANLHLFNSQQSRSPALIMSHKRMGTWFTIGRASAAELGKSKRVPIPSFIHQRHIRVILLLYYWSRLRLTWSVLPNTITHMFQITAVTPQAFPYPPNSHSPSSTPSTPGRHFFRLPAAEWEGMP
jgi:hypothetical protein